MFYENIFTGFAYIELFYFVFITIILNKLHLLILDL